MIKNKSVERAMSSLVYDAIIKNNASHIYSQEYREEI